MEIDGQKLYLQREKVGLSRTELADKAHVTYVRIWQLETGVKSKVSPLLAASLSKILKIDAKKLELI